MKRLFAAALLAPTLITSAAAAFYSFPGDAGAQFGYAAVYGADGTLLRVVRAELSDGTAEIDTADSETVKLILPDATILPGEKAPEPTAAPTVSPEPTAAPAPTASPSGYRYEEWFDKALYEKDAYAQNAPALVKKAQKTVGSDGDIVYNVTLLIGATEQEFVFDEDFKIERASDAYPDAVGQNASYLKAGDVIILSYPFRDEPRDMCLLYRPSAKEPFSSERDFSPLYTTDGLAAGVWAVGTAREVGYSFGIVTKTSSRYFTLADGSGKRIDDISFKERAAVYSYDVTDKTSAEIAGTGAITASEIPDGDIDDDGNVLRWADDCNRTYALVRTIGSAAVDIFIYEY